jgi:hypothetical protein
MNTRTKIFNFFYRLQRTTDEFTPDVNRLRTTSAFTTGGTVSLIGLIWFSVLIAKFIPRYGWELAVSFVMVPIYLYGVFMLATLLPEMITQVSMFVFRSEVSQKEQVIFECEEDLLTVVKPWLSSLPTPLREEYEGRLYWMLASDHRNEFIVKNDNRAAELASSALLILSLVMAAISLVVFMTVMS